MLNIEVHDHLRSYQTTWSINPPLSIATKICFDSLTYDLGHEPTYFRTIKSSESFEPYFLSLQIAMSMEIAQKSRTVGEYCGGMRFNAIRQHCLSVGFLFDDMIRDHAFSESQQTLKKWHAIGHKRIRDILAQKNVTKKRGNHRTDVSDEQILQTRKEVNSDREAARKLGICHTTVARRLKRCQSSPSRP